MFLVSFDLEWLLSLALSLMTLTFWNIVHHPTFFFLECPSFGVCLMIFHNYIQILHSKFTITLMTMHPSQCITLEACDFQLPLVCGVNFDYWSRCYQTSPLVWLPFPLYC